MSEMIRLCTWNIQLGLQLEQILQTIQSEPAFRNLDLLALQEASIHSEEDDAFAIASAFGPSFHSHQVTAHFLGRYVQANALVWNQERIHIYRTDTVILPRVREVKVSRAERALLCALPQQQRISLVADGTSPMGSLRLYVAHLDVLGVAHKREQFYRILHDTRTRQPAADLTILAGDLNTFRIHSRPSWAHLTQAAQAEGFDDLTSEVAFTHHTLRRVRFRQKLDAIFVRYRGPIDCRYWALDIPGSDHIPVFAELVLS